MCPTNQTFAFSCTVMSVRYTLGTNVVFSGCRAASVLTMFEGKTILLSQTKQCKLFWEKPCTRMHLISNQIEIYLALNIPRGGGYPTKLSPRSNLLSFWIPFCQKRCSFRILLIEKNTPFAYFHNWLVLWINRQKKEVSFSFLCSVK